MANNAELIAPITPLLPDDGRPTWQQIVDLFRSHGAGQPPTQLRDEIVNLWSWAHYGKAVADRLAAANAILNGDQPMTFTDAQIKHMVDRFLGWRLPENFNPDCGIHFDADEAVKLNPINVRYEPVGTNLFDYTQAEAMVRHMVEDMT